jgi:hypothetical protein
VRMVGSDRVYNLLAWLLSEAGGWRSPTHRPGSRIRLEVCRRCQPRVSSDGTIKMGCLSENRR